MIEPTLRIVRPAETDSDTAALAPRILFVTHSIPVDMIQYLTRKTSYDR